MLWGWSTGGGCCGDGPRVVVVADGGCSGGAGVD